MLDLPPTPTRQRIEQAKEHASAVEIPHNPLDEAAKDTKGSRLGRGKSWMSQTEESVIQEYQLIELEQTKEWVKHSDRFRHLYETPLSEHLRRHRREWPAEIKLLIEENSKSQVDRRLGHQRPARLGFYRKARCDRHPRRQCRL